MIELLIPDVAPSLNKLLRMHWTRRKKLASLWQRWVWVALSQQGCQREFPFPKAKVSIERRGKRALDKDNLYGSAKVICDSLRYNRIIEDDTEKHIDLTVTQCLGEPRTMVYVWPQ